MKGRFKEISVRGDSQLLDALKVMEKGTFGIVFIVDSDEKLIGVLNDIDLRQALLSNKPMNMTVDKYMNPHPVCLSENAGKAEAMELKRKHPTKRVIPVVDDKGRVVGIETTYLVTTAIANRVIILAGGKGMRLRPLTENKPKPMLTIKNKPLLEITILRLSAQGFKNIHISINYHGDQIKKHFGDGNKHGVNIEYIEEKERLGTAGSLSLMENIHEPCIVLNGDILTKVDYRALLDYHLAQGNKVTVALYEYDFQVPFGVANIKDDGCLKEIEEKPAKTFFVNAGIYVLDSDIVARIPKGKTYDMTSLIDDLIKKGYTVGCFLISEYWIDVGRQSEYQKANEDFEEFFIE